MILTKAVSAFNFLYFVLAKVWRTLGDGQLVFGWLTVILFCTGTLIFLVAPQGYMIFAASSLVCAVFSAGFWYDEFERNYERRCMQERYERLAIKLKKL